MQSSTVYNGDSNTPTPFNPSSNVNNVNGFNNFAQKTSASSNVDNYNEVREIVNNGANNGLRASQPIQQRQVVSEAADNQNINGTINSNNSNATAATAAVSAATAMSEAAATNVKLIKNQQTIKPVNRGRSLFVEIQPARRNKLRKCLERVKKPFEEAPNGLRLADAQIIDALLRCAEVSTSKLKERLEQAYSKPAFLPSEDEVFELSLEEPQQSSNSQENNQGRRDRRDNRNSNLRVELSIVTSNYISSIQRELTYEMGWQPDINAVANVLIDLARHSPRQIVLTISEHYEDIVKRQKTAS